MDNAANEAYGALPERLYVIKDGNIVYVVIISLKRLFVSN